ncbi:terminase, partial [Acetobacter okinawensis]
IQAHKKTITFLQTGATLQIKTFSPDVMTGVKPSGVLVDEEHVIAEKSDASRVMGQIRGGMISQPEAFLLIITTQSEKPPRGVFKADLMKARSIRDGEVQGHTLPILYEFPEDLQKISTIPGEPAPWEKPACWHMVLPNAGRSITVERLKEDYTEAKAAGLEELVRWASQHLNVEIGLALRNDRWAGADYWMDQADSELTLEEIQTRSDVIVAGIDGGGLDDMLSLVIMGRDSVTAEWLCWSRSWVNHNVLEIRKKEASQFLDFEKQGDLWVMKDPCADI